MQLHVLAIETYHIFKNITIFKNKNKKTKKLIIETKSKIKILTGSFENRSSEAGKPNVTSDWFRYLAQCSKLFISANVYSLKQNDNVVSRCKNENPKKESKKKEKMMAF